MLAIAGILAAGRVSGAGPASATATDPATAAVHTVPGMPAVIDARNLYSETGPTHLSPAVKDHLERVYISRPTASRPSSWRRRAGG